MAWEVGRVRGNRPPLSTEVDIPWHGSNRHSTTSPGSTGERRRVPAREGRAAGRLARYAVPVAVAGVAAATISLVPALADAGDPSLPSITAEQLLTKIAASDSQTVDGSVRITTDLGLEFGGAV